MEKDIRNPHQEEDEETVTSINNKMLEEVKGKRKVTTLVVHVVNSVHEEATLMPSGWNGVLEFIMEQEFSYEGETEAEPMFP